MLELKLGLRYIGCRFRVRVGIKFTVSHRGID